MRIRILTCGLLFSSLLFTATAPGAPALSAPNAELSREVLARASHFWRARRGPSPRTDGARAGALSGRRIAVSAGHGIFFRWENASGEPFEAWDWQRGVMQELREDTHNAQLVLEFLIPLLERAGADVVHVRERSYALPEQVIDNDGGDYAEAGTWSTSESVGFDGGTYRFAYVDAAGASEARWDFVLPEAGEYPVYVWFLASWNRIPAAHYTVHHYGGSTEVVLDQHVLRVESWDADSYPNTPPSAADEGTMNGHWHYLGTFPFVPEEAGAVVLSSQGEDSDLVVIADAIRVGASESGVTHLGATSGRPRWDEAAIEFLEAMGLPAWLRVNDPVCRSLYACYEGVDAYLAFHTNCCSGSGTQMYTWYPEMWVGENSWPVDFIDEELPPGTYEWSDAILAHVVSRIRTLWDPDWTSYGHLGADFAELRPQRMGWAQDRDDGVEPPLTIPAALIEAAYHDAAWDTLLIEQLGWRHDVARAITAGMIRYFEGADAVTPPLAPVAVAATSDAEGLRLSWRPAPDPGDENAAPAAYRVYRSVNPLVFPREPALETGALDAVFSVAPCEGDYFRVSAVNEAGESLPGPTVGARRAPTGMPRLLWVNGVDREVRNVWDPTNLRDYARIWGPALEETHAGAGFFDMATDDAVAEGLVALADYAAVAWSTGETSTWQGSLSATERAAIADYLAGGEAAFWLSGAEIGWDLVDYAADGSESFLPEVLFADYLSDDAESTRLEAPETSPLAALGSFAFGDCSADAPCVEWPDVLGPLDGGRVLLWYEGSADGAAVLREADGDRIAVFGFPVESVADPDTRHALITTMTERLAPGLAEATWSCRETPVVEPVADVGAALDVVTAPETVFVAETVAVAETVSVAETMTERDLGTITAPDLGGIPQGNGHSCSAGAPSAPSGWLAALLVLFFLLLGGLRLSSSRR